MRRRRRLAAVTVLFGVSGFVLLQLPGSGALQSVGALLLLGALFAVIGVVVGMLGPQSGEDRDRETRAREEFDRTGTWPANS